MIRCSHHLCNNDARTFTCYYNRMQDNGELKYFSIIRRCKGHAYHKQHNAAIHGFHDERYMTFSKFQDISLLDIEALRPVDILKLLDDNY